MTTADRATRRRADGRAAIAWVVLAFLLARLVFGVCAPLFEPWHLQATDRLFELRASRKSEEASPVHPAVVCVAIDQASLRSLGSLYLDRRFCAQAVEALGGAGAKAQAWDVIFGEGDGDRDAPLVNATKGAPGVFYGMLFERGAESVLETGPTLASEAPESDAPGDTSNGGIATWTQAEATAPDSLFRSDRPLATFPALAESARGLGHLNVIPDRDGVLRRVPLVIRHAGGLVPGLGLAAACEWLGVSQERVEIRPGRFIRLRDASFPGESEPRDVHIPIDRRGNALVDFILPWEAIPTVQFAEVAEDAYEFPEIYEDAFGGKLVIVGDVSVASQDIGAVPTDAAYPLVGMHVSVVSSILNGRFLREPSTLESILLEAALALLLVAASRFRGAGFVGGAIVSAALLVGASVVAFLSFGLVLNAVRPLGALVIAVGFVVVHRYVGEQRERARTRALFESYFPPEVVGKMMARADGVESATDKKVLTVLFSDVVGFSSASADRDPFEIQACLSEYFDAMAEIVFRHGGTLDKFIGDGLMVFFGDPLDQKDHARRATAAAVDMQREVRRLAVSWEEKGWMPLAIRIGIHTGSMFVGNMGSPRRMSYTVLGSEVNLAARLEPAAPHGGILVSDETYRNVRDAFECERHGEIQAKGFDQPISTWTVKV